MSATALLREIRAEVTAFVLSACCAGCDAPGELLCPVCAAELVARPRQLVTPQGLVVHAALPFDAVPARCIRRLKEEGETMLARPLGRALAEVLAKACAVDSGARVVPVPTSVSAFRRRGYRVPELLVRRAGVVPTRLLVAARAIADQRELSRAARAENVHGSMRARHARDLGAVVLVDDVVTTGATLDEAARAMRSAGFRVIGAASLAATALRDQRASDVQ